MKAKLGMLVTEASGSLGGHTIQNSRGGMQLRNKPIPRSAPTAAQYAIRSINPLLQAGWRSLTDAQRKIWNRYSYTHSIMNANGDKHPLSGHSLWMKYQFGRISVGLSFLLNPADYLKDYWSSNLWTNSTFDVQTPWVFVGDVNIIGAKLNIGPITFNRAYAPAIVTAGRTYRVEFDLVPLTIPANLLLRNVTNKSLFDKFYLAGPTYPAGHYKVDMTCILSSVTVGFFQEAPRNGYSVDNVSLKEFISYP